MKPFTPISNPKDIRRRLGMNQQQFWSRIGVTQSGGSRYESGRSMPKPVRELLRIVHLEGVQLEAVDRKDLRIVNYVKRNKPALYKQLSKAAIRKEAR